MSNFTPRAQQVLALARKEADRFHHNNVGTEHLLLGLINLGQGVAVNVLQKMGLDLDTVRQAVDEQVGGGPGPEDIGAGWWKRFDDDSSVTHATRSSAGRASELKMIPAVAPPAFAHSVRE